MEEKITWERIYRNWEVYCEYEGFEPYPLSIREYLVEGKMRASVYFYNQDKWNRMKYHFSKYPNTRGWETLRDEKSGINHTAYLLYENRQNPELIAATFILATLQNIYRGNRNHVSENFCGEVYDWRRDIRKAVADYFSPNQRPWHPPAAWETACTTVLPITLSYRIFSPQYWSDLIKISIIEAMINMSYYKIAFFGDRHHAENSQRLQREFPMVEIEEKKYIEVNRTRIEMKNDENLLSNINYLKDLPSGFHIKVDGKDFVRIKDIEEDGSSFIPAEGLFCDVESGVLWHPSQFFGD